MRTYSYRDVAQWFLSQESMTPKKLQKLCYYFQAWSNALFDMPLISDTKFQAWVHGPVSPQLYSVYRGYGWNYIPDRENNDEIFEDAALELLYAVWNTYGDKSANELEALTHQETPWINARRGYGAYENSNVEISDQDMAEYYKSIYIGG